MKKFLSLFLIITSMMFSATDYIARGIFTNDGRLLEGENVEIKHPLNSITELMSGLIVFDKISEGKLSLNSITKVLEIESKLDGSKMPLKAGEEVKVEDLLIGMLLGNQNNATLILARLVAKNETEFVKLMNAKAKKLGMKNTIFYTSTGLHADITKKKSDVGTVTDINKMMNSIYKNKAMYNMLVQKSMKIKDKSVTIDNVNKISSKDPLAIGIRQGYYASTGYNVIFTTSKEGKNYTVILLGSLSEEARNSQINEEIDALKNNFKTSILISAGEFIIEAPLKDGKEKRIALYAGKDIREEIKSDWKLNKYVFLPKEIKAPIKKGEKVGTYIISYEGREIGRTDLVTTVDIPKSNFLDEIKKKFTK